MKTHIHPTFDKLLQRSDKERLLNQKGIAIWMTGLSGSGKTTIAAELEKKLFSEGFYTQLLDGDNVRTGINNNLGFSETDRTENIRRIAEVTKLFVNGGVITICCFVSPVNTIREQAKNIIGAKDFVEVYINTPLEICEQRDVKGLYKKARAGEIPDFTGISAPFEAPSKPDIEIKTHGRTVEESAQELFEFILPKIKP